MTEHDIQKRIIQHLRLKGYLTIGTDVMAGLGFLGGNTGKRIEFINHHKSLGYTKGQVDFVAIKDGIVLFIECKDKKGKRTKEQEQFAETLINQGLDYYLVRDIKDLDGI